jgi:putative long chain acyl-CoA synthase
MAAPATRRRSKARSPVARVTRWAKASVGNLAEMLRFGRFESSTGAPYEVVYQDKVFRLRRYTRPEARDAAIGPLVLVPPLMVTSEVYDVAPESSAVSTMALRGVDTWVVDFGAPEREEGGMARTLDDHVSAVSRAIDEVRARTGRDVHLAGYSQGGMFCYQAAALRRSDGVASLITFGSPIDIHRNVPNVKSDAVALLVQTLDPLLFGTLQRIEGLPAKLTSTGFKLLTPHKEVEQLVHFVRNLHDRRALVTRERKRRFLAGEGFVAWPGPALQKFVDEFVVHNRMLSGGFVIDGRTVSVSDIRCPVLAFVGLRDDMARPPAVRAIARAAPDAEVHVVEIEAGHFGLVVGTRAMQETWPTVFAWLEWREGRANKPRRLEAPPEPSVELPPMDEGPDELDVDFELDYEAALRGLAGVAAEAWRRMGDALTDAADTARAVRTQVPLLRELEAIRPDTRVSASLWLRDRARELPDETFFLWRGRAFSYREADQRVDRVVRGLVDRGLGPGARVGVFMEGRPSMLSVCTALSRLGAVAVVLPPSLDDAELCDALREVGCGGDARAGDGPVGVLVTDPEHAERARALGCPRVLVLGGGASRVLPEGVEDLEAVDPERVVLPEGLALDDGRARDLALAFVTHASQARTERRAAVHWITNHRWAVSALGAAAACSLRRDDTVYACLPLHHPTGLLVSVGAAIVGGARLALAERFEADTFFAEVRRYGATVAFYAGEMVRPLLLTPPRPTDRDVPLRLFAGSGMRADLAREVSTRFGLSVLEFWASTSENVVLANTSGQKHGSVGRPMPGSAELALARWDFERGELARDERGRLVFVDVDAPGVGLVRLDPGDARERPASRVVTAAFPGFPEARYVILGDILRRDLDGDHWLVDSVRNVLPVGPSGFASPRSVEDALYRAREVAFAAVLTHRPVGAPARLVAVVEPARGRELEPERIAAALESLPPEERPSEVLQVARMPLTTGFRPDMARLVELYERGELTALPSGA